MPTNPLDSYADDRPHWEQQDKETPQAYAAFRIYARQPYATPSPDRKKHSRSIASVAQELGKSVSLCERWSRRWRWVDRARAYDADKRQADRDALREAESAQAAEVARRRLVFKDKAWGLFERTVGQLEEMLAYPIFEAAEEVVDRDKSGRPTTVIVRNPVGGWTPSSAASLMRAGALIGQVATDDGTGALDALVSRLNFEDLPDDVLDSLETGNASDFLEALIASGSHSREGQGGESEAEEAEDVGG